MSAKQNTMTKGRQKMEGEVGGERYLSIITLKQM